MTTTTTGIEFLDLYQEMLAHQKQHDGLMLPPIFGEQEQPSWTCMGCLREHRPIEGDPMRDLRKRYSFAIPNPAALDAIAKHSPGGVVELGAGGGYWAMLLQQRGVDVIAYDPEPPGSGESHWHSGQAWTAVHRGDHAKAAEHPTRTLMLLAELRRVVGSAGPGCVLGRHRGLHRRGPRRVHGGRPVPCPRGRGALLLALG